MTCIHIQVMLYTVLSLQYDVLLKFRAFCQHIFQKQALSLSGYTKLFRRAAAFFASAAKSAAPASTLTLP